MVVKNGNPSTIVCVVCLEVAWVVVSLAHLYVDTLITSKSVEGENMLIFERK